MIGKRANLVLILAIISITLLLYAPTFSGTLIWDDKFFWFMDPVITKNFSYLTIWKDFNWPLSVSIQKLLFSWWGDNYIPYHLMNFILHALNGLLVYRLFNLYRIPYAILGFAFFMLQPASMISVAWMIQFKTLLCLLFALLSLLYFKSSESKSGNIFLSYIFYFFSLLSKSASIPAGLIFFILGKKKFEGKKIVFLIPFLLLSLFSTYRLINSPVTEATLEKIDLKNTEALKAESVINDFPKAKKPNEAVKIEAPSQTFKEIPKVQEKPVEEERFFSPPVLQILHYYFWQSILPIKTHPVHSPTPPKIELIHYGHIFFILLLIIINLRKMTIWPLIFGHLMLTPFLGFIFAPYMNVTWVSDQHLYLALPFFIAFWLFLFHQIPIPLKLKLIIPALVFSFYSYQLYKTAPLYKDEISFFKSSLDEEVINLPITYNLAVAYYSSGNKTKAIELLKNTILLSKSYPEIQKDDSFPAIVYFYFQLQGEKK